MSVGIHNVDEFLAMWFGLECQKDQSIERCKFKKMKALDLE